MESTNDSEVWTSAKAEVFWGEIAPCDHVLQIYQNDEEFLDCLYKFVSGGFDAGDGVIVIATSTHLASLDSRLRQSGYDLFTLKLRDQYIPLDAEETLASFMVNGWPDPILFGHVVSELISRAKRYKRHVRAFGEMVALLWSRGNSGATIQLEHLWNRMCNAQPFSLFCAYPHTGFTQNAKDSLETICKSHSKMIQHGTKAGADIFFRTTERQRSA